MASWGASCHVCLDSPVSWCTPEVKTTVKSQEGKVDEATSSDAALASTQFSHPEDAPGCDTSYCRVFFDEVFEECVLVRGNPPEYVFLSRRFGAKWPIPPWATIVHDKSLEPITTTALHSPSSATIGAGPMAPPINPSTMDSQDLPKDPHEQPSTSMVSYSVSTTSRYPYVSVWLRFPIKFTDKPHILDATFSPNLSLLAVRTSDKEIRIYDCTTGKAVECRSCRGSSVSMLSVHWVSSPTSASSIGLPSLGGSSSTKVGGEGGNETEESGETINGGDGMGDNRETFEDETGSCHDNSDLWLNSLLEGSQLRSTPSTISVSSSTSGLGSRSNSIESVTPTTANTSGNEGSGGGGGSSNTPAPLAKSTEPLGGSKSDLSHVSQIPSEPQHLLFATTAGVELHGLMNGRLQGKKKTVQVSIVDHWYLPSQSLLVILGADSVFQAYKVDPLETTLTRICKFELDYGDSSGGVGSGMDGSQAVDGGGKRGGPGVDNDDDDEDLRPDVGHGVVTAEETLGVGVGLAVGGMVGGKGNHCLGAKAGDRYRYVSTCFPILYFHCS